jgi:cell volume regulation protein A
MDVGPLILASGALLCAGLLASLLAVRVRVPSLVLFLGVGMVIGSIWIDFNDYELARAVGIVALALILYEGGLNSGFLEIRPVLGAALSLAVLGTIVTAVVTGLTAAWLFDLSTLEGLLLGSILSATDGAAIFALLRGSTLERRLARTLEGESGFNDPVAVVLVLGFIDWIEHPGFGIVDLAREFAVDMGVGLVVGTAVGWLAVQAFQRARLASSGLYPVASLALAAVSFGLADIAHGSGFLAVYLTGLMLGSANVPAKTTVAAFHDGLGWVAQLTMFLTLGLLVFPDQLDQVWLEGTVLALVVVFVARPLAAWLSTLPFGFRPREQLLLGWAGLRGAVPVVLATFPVIDRVPGALEFFNIVFFAVLLSTILQGTTMEWLARKLELTTTEPAIPRPLQEAGTVRGLGAEILEYRIDPDDAIVGAPVRDLALPRDAVVNVIVREGEAIPPRGSTRLRAHDQIHVLLRTERAGMVRGLSDRWRTGPIGPPPRPERRVNARHPIFSSWRWATERDGDMAEPGSVRGEECIAHIRIRRDEAGGLFALADGRYAVTGDFAAIGGREDLSQWARRRMRRATPDERAWLQTVIGALASDMPE